MMSPTMCEKMLCHWKNKVQWLNLVDPTFPLNEIWDGYRFKELSWFWDPNKSWVIPQKCSKCHFYNQLKDVQTDGEFMMTCTQCGEKEIIKPEFATGDPRNIGLIGHFDGWKPGFGNSKHGSGRERLFFKFLY